MKVLTVPEWEATPDDYKLQRPDGTRAVLVNDPETGGTVLEPVALEREPFVRRVRVGTSDTGYKRRAVVSVDIHWNGARLSISGDEYRPGAADIDSGGQILETVAGLEGSALELEPAVRDRLVEVWERWHLNDMRAGCEHQRAELERPAVGAACPECGYRYGSAWLREDVPADVLDFLAGLGEVV